MGLGMMMSLCLLSLPPVMMLPVLSKEMVEAGGVMGSYSWGFSCDDGGGNSPGVVVDVEVGTGTGAGLVADAAGSVSEDES